ncbi:MAG: hypothetical protein WEA04_04965 [Candidatus Andersenbacteria bacterium]
MYIHYIQFNGSSTYRLYIGPFDTEVQAEVFKQRMVRTRESSPHLTMQGVALEIAPGIDGRWGVVTPDQFKGFCVFDMNTEREVNVPLAD